MTAMLASVRSLDEARLALAGGADLIDLKEPSQGALGALDHAAVRICVKALGGIRPLSATVGDDPEMDPERITAAVDRMAATGVDYIKVGFFNRPRAVQCAHRLAGCHGRSALIGVLFADDAADYALIDALARSGFAGVMLDTARKDGRSLRDWCPPVALDRFVGRARGLGLLTGMAGSLKAGDIGPLLAHGPDYLGFRGALCRNGMRGLELDAAKLAHVRSAMPVAAENKAMARVPAQAPDAQEKNAAAAAQSDFPRSRILKSPAA